MKTAIVLALACQLTHNDGAELTLRHFMVDPGLSHVEVTEIVNSYPDWLKWRQEHITCLPGACHCTEH
jgi:hypothetical protein